jgi:hypothetical protein
MKYGKRRIPMLALSLGVLFAASAAQAQVVGYNFRSGDLWVDTRLGEINDYGSRYREPFIGEMTGYYGAPRPLIVDLFDRRWSAGDIYYACSIAHVLGIPCVDVVREYDRNPGQGWGAIAKRMGIKPGSAQFHRLKNGFSHTYDRWGYPVAVDRNVHVDWSKHGPGKKSAQGGRAQGGGAAHSGKVPKASVDHGQGKGKSGQDKGNGNGKGNGKDKGNGKGNGKGH